MLETAMRPLLLSLFLTGCATHRIDALEARLEALELRVAADEARPAPAEAPAGPSAADETAAAALFKTATDDAAALDYAGARGALTELHSRYPATKANTRSARLDAELALIGTDVSAVAPVRWLQGQASFAGSQPMLVVFVEQWCPHCREEQPKLQELSTRWLGRLDVVAITQLTRTATEQNTREWIAQDHVTYAFGVEDGAMSTAYGVTGIPAAAVIRGGKVIWRGHPNKLDDPTIDKILAL